jgi:tetratricopeptide (TPR) repeat protein
LRKPAWILAGLLLSGLIALNLTRATSRPASPVREGQSAYERGDWSRASELARQRLRAVPDDQEAVRLLARSLARLGRDGPANALFARLGKDSLAAEDLFLLGLGLKRSGQEDRAIGLWEKGLAAEPDQSEMLEELALAYTARNRLVEGARLYGRLASLPGWELRGGLSWGALLAELNDPEGAAAALAQSLARPDARSLDPAIMSRYQKLLARCLLRMGSAESARNEIESVLRAGPDSEASWLLSRAWLQLGAKEQAVLALGSARDHRALHPLDLEPGPYVGEARCAACHRDISQAYHGSRSSRTLHRGEQLLNLHYPVGTVADPADPTVTHRFTQREGKVHLETTAQDRTLQAVVDYAFGSADRYVSLVGHDAQGQAYILRLSRYEHGPRESGWVRTTGHTADADSGRDFLGKPMEPADGVLRCLFCHSTNPQAVLADRGPESRDRAIGCERCHGPGSNHLRAVELNIADPAIVSPAQGSGEGSIRLCAQCHAYHQKLDLPREDPFWIRFQGTTLPWSRCYTESGGALDCTTCHDPHRDAEHSASFYEAKCLSCHSPSSGVESPGQSHAAPTRARGRTCPVDARRNCVGCHMPDFRSNPLHATFSDHYIRVHPELKRPRSP